MTARTDLDTPTHVEAAPEMPSAPRLPRVRFRPFRDDSDYERLSGLLKAGNRHDEIPWLPTVSNLRSEMGSRTAFDPRRDLLIAELGDQMIGMTGVERVVRDGAPVYEMWGAVLPEFRRLGLGTALLTWTLDRARRRAAVEDPGVAVQVAGDAEEQEIGHRALLRQAGFEPVRDFFLMRRPTLDDVPEAPLPEGLEIGGAILSDQLKSLDWRTRHAKLIARAPDELVGEVLAKAATLLA